MCSSDLVIAFTANAFENDRADCIAAGMNDFVPKPISPALLQEALLRWLGAPEDSQPLPRESRATGGAGPAATLSPEALEALLAELESRLGAGDLETRRLARDNAAALRSGLGDVAEAVLDAIDHFDYEAAQILVTRARLH